MDKHQTPQETQMTNALIALFMGAEYKKDDYGDMGYFFKEPLFKEWHTGFSRLSLKFHSSWDWLMPVVIKIVHECSGSPEWKEFIEIDLFNMNLDWLYTKVVDFINFYNKSKANEQGG